jgi:hypothetical protein
MRVHPSHITASNFSNGKDHYSHRHSHNSEEVSSHGGLPRISAASDDLRGLPPSPARRANQSGDSLRPPRHSPGLSGIPQIRCTQRPVDDIGAADTDALVERSSGRGSNLRPYASKLRLSGSQAAAPEVGSRLPWKSVLFEMRAPPRLKKSRPG